MTARVTNGQRSRIVILGGGFGGAYCARTLEKRVARHKATTLLLDRNNYFVFYPLLIEAGAGAIEPRHAVVPIRSFLNTTQFRRTEIVGIDTGRQEVHYRLIGSERPESTPYDHLVLALGSVTRMPDIPGLKEHGYAIKGLADAIGLRDRVIHLLELADTTPDPEERRALLHIIVVGGNYTGVEFAGEFQSFMREASAGYRNVSPNDCRITLVEITNRILPALDPELASYAARQLNNAGVRIVLKRSITALFPGHVTLDDGSRLLSHTTVWAAGVTPNPLIAKLPVPVDDRGYIVCGRDLRVAGFNNIWAIGDCASNPGPDHKPYPATAQHALREGRDLARNIVLALEGATPRPCDIPMRGSMASLGGHKGVAKVFNLKLTGFPAWFFRQSYYLARMPGWSRKARLAFDWALNLIFSRDIVQLGLRSSPPDPSIRKAA